jgi:hypothetical protein
VHAVRPLRHGHYTLVIAQMAGGKPRTISHRSIVV